MAVGLFPGSYQQAVFTEACKINRTATFKDIIHSVQSYAAVEAVTHKQLFSCNQHMTLAPIGGVLIGCQGAGI